MINPHNIFPTAIADFIVEFARASQAPQKFSIIGVLGAATHISSEVILKPKNCQSEWGNLFLCVVADKGWSKSANLSMPLQPLFQLQKGETEEYASRQMAWQKALDMAGKRDKKELEGHRPDPNQQFVATKGTIEGLFAAMNDNYRGGWGSHAMMLRDELSGFFRDMNEYKSGGKGSDMETWLSLFNGFNYMQQNKMERFTIHDARASLMGTIQTEVFTNTMDDKTMENGMFDRFLFCVELGFPPKTDPRLDASQVFLDKYKAHMDACMRDYRRGPDTIGAPRIVLTYTDAQKEKLVDVYEKYHSIGAAHNTGAFKKWDLKLHKLMINMTCLHRERTITDEVFDKTLALNDWFNAEWLMAFNLSQQSDIGKARHKTIQFIKTTSGCSHKKLMDQRFMRNIKTEQREILVHDLCKEGVLSVMPGDDKRSKGLVIPGPHMP